MSEQERRTSGSGRQPLRARGTEGLRPAQAVAGLEAAAPDLLSATSSEGRRAIAGGPMRPRPSGTPIVPSPAATSPTVANSRPGAAPGPGPSEAIAGCGPRPMKDVRARARANAGGPKHVGSTRAEAEAAFGAGSTADGDAAAGQAAPRRSAREASVAGNPGRQDQGEKRGGIQGARSGSGTGSQAGRPGGKQPKKPTPERMRRIAEHYVGQRECSSAMLQATLARWRDAWLRRQPDADRPRLKAETDGMILAEVERMMRLGFVDDARFARLKARSGLASGKGLRRVAMGLRQKGLADEAIERALDEGAQEWLEEQPMLLPILETDENDGEALDPEEARRIADAAAARTFAEKRRLGPWRRTPLPEDRKERAKAWSREAGSMARAGFGFDLIRSILDEAPDDEDGIVVD